MRTTPITTHPASDVVVVLRGSYDIISDLIYDTIIILHITYKTTGQPQITCVRKRVERNEPSNSRNPYVCHIECFQRCQQ